MRQRTTGSRSTIGFVLTVSLLLTGLMAADSGEEFNASGNSVRFQESGRLNDEAKERDEEEKTTISVTEARHRARILHDAFGGALQVMHRDFFREDQRLKLPSKSLEDVFAEMLETHQIVLRWLAVNANAMNVDHQPKTDFDKQAIKVLSGNNEEFEMVSNDTFRFAGAIPLSASCVRCHVRNRTSNNEKKAALSISIPLKSR